MTAANLIYYSALENQINPVLLLAKIDQEQGLISNSESTFKDYQRTLNRATGFGITNSNPDGDPTYAGFFAQLVASTFQFDKSRREGKNFREAYDSYTQDPELGQDVSFSNFMTLYYNPSVEQMNQVHPGACQSLAVTSNVATTVTTAGDKASFVRETYPDGTSVSAGAAFEKQWTLKNTGTTTWNSGYKLRYKDGSLSQKKEIPIVGTVAPGNEYTFTVPMQAPQAPGPSKENWELVSPTGAVIMVGNSPTVWAQIQVAGSTIATNFTSGSCLMLPVKDEIPDNNIVWNKDGNPFGNYLGSMGGYHPGEDWNL